MRTMISAFVILGFFALVTRADTPDGTTKLTDGTVTFELITRSNHQTLVVTDTAAKLNFEGAFTTDADRAKAPPAILDAYRLAGLHKELSFWQADEWAIVGARMEHVLKYQRWLGTDIPNADPALMAIYCQADPDNPLPPVLQKMAEVLRGPTADFELKTVIGAYREARHKTEVELERAQDDLKKVVTVRQELILIRMGILR